MVDMEYIDLRKVGREGLKEIRRQVVGLKELRKTGKEIEELTGVRQNRASEIWKRINEREKARWSAKVWMKTGEPHGSYPGRTREYPDGIFRAIHKSKII